MASASTAAERFEKALKRTEQLTSIIVILSAITLFLLFVI